MVILVGSLFMCLTFFQIAFNLSRKPVSWTDYQWSQERMPFARRDKELMNQYEEFLLMQSSAYPVSEWDSLRVIPWIQSTPNSSRAEAISYEGLKLIKDGDDLSAVRKLSEAVELLEKQNDTNYFYAITLTNLGTAQTNLGKFREAMASNLKAESVFDKLYHQYEKDVQYKFPPLSYMFQLRNDALREHLRK